MPAIALLAAVGCGHGDQGTADGALAADAAVGDGAQARGEGGSLEVGPVVSCQQNADCPARFFCGITSKSCVSAVVQVVAGAQHSCAIHDSGQVSCWGLAESIRAGGAAVLAPALVPGVAPPLQLAAGTHLTCAITQARRVACWGNQQLVVLGDDGTPISEVRALALGADYGCAVTSEGTRCWGKNDFGQLARPLTVKDSATAVLAQPKAAERAGADFVGTGIAVVSVSGGQLCAWGRNATKLISAADDLGVQVMPQCRSITDVAELAVGDTHACVRHAAGTFTCWGERYYGELGLGGTDTADVGPPGSVTSLPGPVAQLVAGVSHSCALLMDGRVICFGRNNLGQVGPGAATSDEEVRMPAPVTGFSGKVIALGAGSTAQHTCAIVADGSVQCWGSDDAGQLGDGAASLDPTRQSRGPVDVRF